MRVVEHAPTQQRMDAWTFWYGLEPMDSNGTTTLHAHTQLWMDIWISWNGPEPVVNGLHYPVLLVAIWKVGGGGGVSSIIHHSDETRWQPIVFLWRGSYASCSFFKSSIARLFVCYHLKCQNWKFEFYSGILVLPNKVSVCKNSCSDRSRLTAAGLEDIVAANHSTVPPGSVCSKRVSLLWGFQIDCGTRVVD